MIAEIENLNLEWVEKKELIQTRNGPRRLRTASLDGCREFWKIFKAEKELLNKWGFSPSRDSSGNWVLNQWTPQGGFPQFIEEKPKIEIDETIESYLARVPVEGLLPWQRESVAKIIRAIENHGAALDASDVGTGKTYSALCAAKILGLSPVVICPISVIGSWKKAAAHFGISISVLNYEKLKTGKTEFGDWIDKKKRFSFLNVSQKSILIFDEVHRCKSATSQNSKMLRSAKNQNIPTICLSATAFVDPTEMSAIGEVLGLFKANKFWSWAMSHGCQKGRWGGLEFTGGRKTLAEIHSLIFPKKGTRVKVSELGDAFPETFITTESVEVSKAGAARIDDAIRAARETIERIQNKQANDSDNVLTALLRARQISEAEKVPVMTEMILDAIEQNQSVVVFVNFSETINDLQKTLNSLSISTIHGQQTAEEREKHIDDFQNGKSKLMIANIQAGGVGVSLHDLDGSHPRITLVNPSWSAVAMRQALGRVHRAGGKSKSIQKILFAANTVEEGICEAVEAKLKNLDLMNDVDLL